MGARAAMAAVLIFVVSGCGESEEGAAGSAGFVLRDSAGIEIVEYSMDALASLPLYEPADTFELSIGEVDGPEPYLFGRIAAAAELSDGRIVVVDRSTMALRYFSSDGVFLGEVGRRGEGPGEFQSPDGWWLLPGDTIEVWDSRSNRVSRIAGFLEPIQQIRVDLGGARGFYLGTYDDGSLLFWVRGVRQGPLGERYSGQYAIRLTPQLPGGGTEFDTLSILEEELRPEAEGQPIWRPSGGFGFHPQGVWVWDGLEPEARLTDRAGRLVRIVRWEQPDPTATQEMFDIWLTRALDAMPPEARPQFSASVEDAILPERIPALVGIRSNRRGRGLLVLYPRPDEPSRITPDLWTMSADGRLESRIRGVSPIEPLPLDPDRVVAVEEDELDVPRVRIRAMVRVRSGG